MEDFFTDVLIGPQSSFDQVLDTTILPSLTSAYIISEIKRANTFEAYIETLLFSVYTFLWTQDANSTLTLLIFETFCLFCAYALSSVQLLACFSIALILLTWMLQYDAQHYHHPSTIVMKCLIFFIAKCGCLAPERLVCLAWILKIAYDYVRNFGHKNIHDVILAIVVLQILVVISGRLMIPLQVLFITYFYVAVLVWMGLKVRYLTSRFEINSCVFLIDELV